MTKAPSKYHSIFIIITLLLLFPALFINLGLLPLIADEATRAIVALEMEITGNLITPTIGGEFYLNKPPLYNWILLGFFKLTNNHSELIIRLPAVLSLLLFGLSIYLTTNKKIGKKPAFIVAIAFITMGRMLFYDSMLGLIDLSFSLLIFLNFMLIYHFGRKEQFFRLFILSYLIAAITFLMKGLPAIVFQGISLIAAMIFFRRWKSLFRVPHFLGIFIFLILTGSYYFFLWKENPEGHYFHTLLSESTKRTFVEYGWAKTFFHLISFPAEQILHLLPWSVLLVFMLKKSFYRNIRENQFLSYLALIFIVNIPVYWVSVETYPRYLFTLYPILLILLITHYYTIKTSDKLFKLFWSGVIILILFSLLVGSYLFFNYEFSFQKRSTLIFLGVMVLIVTSLYLLWKIENYRMEILIIILLILRIGFNLVILPDRSQISAQNTQKQHALEVARITSGDELLLHPNTPIGVETMYYISSERMDVLEKTHETAKNGYFYIFDARDPIREKENIFYSFETRWNNRKLRLSKFE